MNLTALILLPAIIAAILGALVYPAVATYFLVLDSWVIGRISDLGDILPGISTNRLMVLLTVALFLLHAVVGSYKIDLRLFRSMTATLLVIFMLYLLASSLFIMGRNDPTLWNNLVFFLLLLLVLGSRTESHLRHMVWIIIGASAFIVLQTLLGRFSMAGELMADVSDGGRIQPGFHVLLSIPFLIAVARTTQHRFVRNLAYVLILVFAMFVISRISRTLVAIAVLLLGLYFVRSRARWKFLLWGVPVLVIGITVGLSSDYGKKLLRLEMPHGGSVQRIDPDRLDAITSGRAAIYPIAWRNFEQNPVFGAGYDSFRRPRQGPSFGLGAPIERGALHSTWLQILSEAGIVGAGLYLALFVSAGLDFLRSQRRRSRLGRWTPFSEAVFFALVIFFFGGFVDNFGFSYRIFFLFVALSIVLSRHTEAGSQPEPTTPPRRRPRFVTLSEPALQRPQSIRCKLAMPNI